jgi:hypothetical protein
VQIRDRVKELRRVKASELRPSPRNWRTHPKAQRDALRGALAEIGYADALLARELPDATLELIDGHLRAETTPDSLVPVLILDVDEAEAAKLLATLDPLAAMATADADKLDALLREVGTESEPLAALLAGLAGANGIVPEGCEAVTDPLGEWRGMPGFENPASAHQHLNVYFASQEDVRAFAQLVGRDVRPTTKTLWFPEKPSPRPYAEVWDSSEDAG